jgi:hypothetical protein
MQVVYLFLCLSHSLFLSVARFYCMAHRFRSAFSIEIYSVRVRLEGTIVQNAAIAQILATILKSRSIPRPEQNAELLTKVAKTQSRTSQPTRQSYQCHKCINQPSITPIPSNENHKKNTHAKGISALPACPNPAIHPIAPVKIHLGSILAE